MKDRGIVSAAGTGGVGVGASMEQRGRTVSPRYITPWLCLAAVLGGCTSTAPPDDSGHVGATAEALTSSVTYRRGVLGTVTDTFISASEMGKGFGAQEKLRVSAKNEALLRFDLSAIPSSAVINSATLSLYLNGGDDEQDDDCDEGSREGFPVVPIKIHRATAAWGESTATFSSFNQQFDPTVAGTVLPTSANVFKSVDLKTLVQQWVGGAPNYGMLIRTTGRRHTIFVSSEGGKVSLRPSLTISYTTPDDHCAPNPCANAGKCQNSANGFTCTCATGYAGPTCQTLVDNCAGSPCMNGGTCTNGVDSYTCSCASGYTGTNCQTNINECAPNPCQNGGVCTDGVNSHTCACAPGYTGANCETLVNNCASSPCQNGGTCTSGVNTYTCSCPAGYTGANCEALVDNCAPNPCQSGGTCANGVNSYTCNCAPGYAGATCGTLVDNCASGPCQNGGSCTNGVGTYACACAPGYSGANCEVDINDCAAQPCGNGGVCVDGINSFSCICAPGFTGATCAVNIDDCAGAPCHHGGTCSDGIASFACACSAAWTGPTCDVAVDACAAQPCLRGGTCTAGNPGEFSCACPPNFGGARCEIDASQGLAVTVPAVPANTTIPHTILAGVATTLKGRALGPATQFSWDFGDGSGGTGWATIADAASLDVKHTYQGPAGYRFFATLSVRLSAFSAPQSAVYPLMVADPASSPDPRTAIAIDEGLWFLHKRLGRSSTPSGIALGSEGGGDCQSLAAFERHGSSVTGSIYSDPYSDDAQRLLANVSLQIHDVHGNGRLMLESFSGSSENLGACGDALLAVPRSYVMPAGAAVGRTLGDLTQGFADGVVLEQFPDGSWVHDPFATYGATRWLDNIQRLGAVVPARVWSAANDWWSSGGAVYTQCSATPSTLDLGWDFVFNSQRLYDALLAGTPASAALIQGGYGFLDAHWSDALFGCAVTEEAAVLALEASNTTQLAPNACDGTATGLGFDWYADPSRGLAHVLAARQRPDGSWVDLDDAGHACFNFAGIGGATAITVSLLIGR